MPELGHMESGQAASLSGLAPIARQSGRWIGKAFIRGGRANVRQALYMPALVAITTIMRKLVVLANALLKAGRPWIPKTA